MFVGGLPSANVSTFKEMDSESDLDLSDSDDDYIPPDPAPESESDSEPESGATHVDSRDPASSEGAEPVPGPSGDSVLSPRTAERRLFFRLNDAFGHGTGISALAEAPAPQNQTSVLTPDGYFGKFIPDTMIRQIADMTNRHNVVKTGRSLLLKPDECRRFFGVNMLMSVLRFPWMRMYWMRKTKFEAISDAISRDRFFKIRSCLKVVSDADVPDEVKAGDRLWKLRPLLDCIREGCVRLPRPKEVSIDEQMIPFSGKSSLKQFMPGKPNPEGLKNFVAATSDGLILDFEIYQGKRLCTRSDPDGKEWYLGESVVMRLIETLDPGTSLYFDRYFTTPRLLEALKDQGMEGTGTIRKNMIPKNANLPQESVVKRWERGQSETHARSDGKLGLTMWKDNKPLCMASTAFGKEPVDKVKRYKKKEKTFIEVERPNVVAKYNINMGGVDLHDRMISHYRSGYRTRKWTIRTILHFFDVAAVQSWLLYKRDCEAVGRNPADVKKFLEFKHDLAMRLIYEQNMSEVHSQSSTESATEEDEEQEAKRPRPCRCRPTPVPQTVRAGQHLPKAHARDSWKRCRMTGCHKLTGTECRQCRIFLCCVAGRDCFFNFHTKK